MPLAASIESRIASASSRRGGNRHKSRAVASTLQPVGPRGRRLPIGGRRQDQPMDVLQRPAAADQFVRQPIEQLGMRRAAAVMPEIGGRLDDAAAEMVMPEPIHHHASRQRILWPSDPTGQGRRDALARAAAGISSGPIAADRRRGSPLLVASRGRRDRADEPDPAARTGRHKPRGEADVSSRSLLSRCNSAKSLDVFCFVQRETPRGVRRATVHSCPAAGVHRSRRPTSSGRPPLGASIR